MARSVGDTTLGRLRRVAKLRRVNIRHLVFAFCLIPSAAWGQAPPEAARIPHNTKIHGQVLSDDYFWLRDRANPRVVPYLDAENAHTEQALKPLQGLREKLYQEFLSRIQEDDSVPPYPQGRYEYFSKTVKGQQYRVYCRYPQGHPQQVETVLDLNEFGKNSKFVASGAFEVSDDGNWLAFSVDLTGYRQYVLQFKNLRTGQVSPERIERVTSVMWGADNKTVYYTTEDPVSKRSDRFFRHTIGASSADVQLFEEKDELFDVSCHRSREGGMLFLNSVAKTSSEVRYAPADGSKPFRLMLARQAGHEYDADHAHHRFYIRSNRGAPNFKVVTAPESDPGPAHWRDLLPYRPSVKIDSVEPFDKYLVLAERRAGSQEIEVLPVGSGAKPYYIPVSEPVHSLDLGANHVFRTQQLRILYQSPITPPTVYDFDMQGRTQKLLKRDPVLGGFDPGRYRTERVDITVRDGTKVPVSLVYRADLATHTPHPMVLYGYGSYGVSIDPEFSSPRISLLDRGVIYAIAHIRGGGELGEPWRLAGRMERKITTFYDFVDCAEGLIRGGRTDKEHLAITGASAGGLLVGVVSNLRPDLFHAVLAKVPFVDVINTMLDASLPLTTGEWIEWGNPNQKADFDTMMAYSPYDNVAAKNYPDMLVRVSLNDSQVPYWEGAKWVAKLRRLKLGNNPILLKVNMAAGHGGSSGRYDALRETAFDYAYLLSELGVRD